MEISKKKKKYPIIIAVLAVVVIAVVIVIFATSSSDNFLTKMFLGDKYVNEISYEQTQIEQEQIEVEKKLVAIYLEKAKAYIIAGEIKKAYDILFEALEKVPAEDQWMINEAIDDLNKDYVLIDSKHFPDKEFRKYVETFDLNSDGLLKKEGEISSVYYLGVIDGEITSIKGIEFFTNVNDACFDGNKIKSVDLSNNKELLFIGLENNDLTSLDVSKLTKLERLNVAGNKLTSLDLTKNDKLTYLDARENMIVDLNISNCPELEELVAENNNIIEIDLSQNAKLQVIRLSENQLSQINLTKCTELQYLDVQKNELSTLDVFNNTKLITVSVYSNKLKTLDIRNCPEIDEETFFYDWGLTIIRPKSH